MKNTKHLFLTLPILVSAVSLGAMTQSQASLYNAKTDWSVHAEKDADYCSVSQGFSGKAYVTFAQRNDNSLSLAVDFQKNTFEAGKTYTFKVKSGSVSRSFKIVPSSKNAVVFPLGEDPNLVGALVETSILSLQVDGDDYDFSLKNPSTMQDKLAVCSANLAPSTKVVTKTKKPSEAQRLKMENRKLNNLLKTQRRETDAKLSSVTSSSRSEEAKERAFILEQDNIRLKAELTSLSSLKQNMESVETLQSDLQNAQSEKDSLQSQLASANSQILSLEGQKAQSVKDIQILDSLKVDLAEKVASLASIEQEKDIISLELKSVKDSLSNMQKGDEAKVVTMESSMKELQTTQFKALSAKDDEILSLQDKVTKAELSSTHLQNALNLNKKEVTRLQDIQKMDDTGSDDLKTLQDKFLKDMASKDAVVSKKTAEIISLESQIKGLEAAQANIAPVDIASSEKQVQLLEVEIATKQTRIDELLVENEKLIGMNSVTSSPDNDVIDDLTAQIDNKNTVIMALENEKKDLELQVKEQVIEEKIVASQAEEYNFLDRRYKSALIDLEAIKTQNISLEDQLVTFEKEIVALRVSEKEIALSPDSSWDLEKATRRYQEAQREIVGLGRVIEQKNAQCDVEKKDIERLLFDPEIASKEQRAKLIDLEREVAEKSAMIATLESQNFSASTSTNKPYVEKIEMIEPAMAPVQKVSTQSVTVDNSSLDAVATIPVVIKQTQKSYMKQLIGKVGLAGVKEQEKGGMKVLRWKQGALHGTALEKPLSGQSLTNIVNAYLSNAESKCGGDFAAIPSEQSENKQAYEIACVKPNGKGSSASLLFIAKNGSFISVAHEGKTELMAQAIEARDEISKAVEN